MSDPGENYAREYQQRPVPTASGVANVKRCYCTRCRGQERAPCKHRFSNMRNAPPPDIAEVEELLIEIWSGWRFPGP